MYPWMWNYMLRIKSLKYEFNIHTFTFNFPDFWAWNWRNIKLFFAALYISITLCYSGNIYPYPTDHSNCISKISSDVMFDINYVYLYCLFLIPAIKCVLEKHTIRKMFIVCYLFFMQDVHLNKIDNLNFQF